MQYYLYWNAALRCLRKRIILLKPLPLEQFYPLVTGQHFLSWKVYYLTFPFLGQCSMILSSLILVVPSSLCSYFSRTATRIMSHSVYLDRILQRAKAAYSADASIMSTEKWDSCEDEWNWCCERNICWTVSRKATLKLTPVLLHQCSQVRIIDYQHVLWGKMDIFQEGPMELIFWWANNTYLYLSNCIKPCSFLVIESSWFILSATTSRCKLIVHSFLILIPFSKLVNDLCLHKWSLIEVTA